MPVRTSRDKSVAAGLQPAVKPGILPGVVGTSRRDVGAACSGATPSNTCVPRTIIPPAAPRAGTAQRAIPTTRAFTLVEIIAVTAVIATLVAVMVPTIIRRVDRAASTRETTDLNSIADAYTQSIIRNKTIPSHTNSASIPNWASAVASQMALSDSSIATNSRRYVRAFLIDPSLRINGAVLPYAQTSAGASNLTSARVMFVSVLARGLPTNIVSGVASSNEFNAIWNTAENATPSTWTNWPGSGEDLRIKKLNLEPLFYRLILVDRTGDTNTARYSIDTNTVMAVPQGPIGLDRYYLDSSVVGLHDKAGGVQARHMLKRNISFLFEADAWRGQIQGDQQKYSASGADFYNHAITFFNRPTNPWGGQYGQGASQYGVMISMYTFMFDYTYWANECPHFNYHGNNVGSVPEYVLLNNQGQNGGNVDDFSSDLLALPPKK